MSWVSGISGFEITAPFFQHKTAFPFFCKPKTSRTYPAACIFGRNGSGKSTIAQAIANFSQSNLSGEIIAEPIPKLSIDLMGEIKESVFIFDQTYIDKNVRFIPQDGGLQTIVLLGEQFAYQQDIDDVNEDIKNLEQERLTLIKEKDAINDHCDEIKTRIKGELTRWSTDKKILSGKNAQLNDSTFKDLVFSERAKGLEIGETLNKEKDQLLTQLKDGLDQIKNSSQYLALESLPSLPCPEVDIDTVSRGLKKIIKKAEAPDLDPLLSTIHSVPEWTSIKEIFSDENLKICPTCLRPVDENLRSKIIKFIDSIVDKESTDFIETLDTLKIKEIANDDLTPWRKVSESLFLEYSSLLDKINKEINNINKKIEYKKSVLDKEVEYSFSDFENYIKQLGAKCSELQLKRDKILKNVRDLKGLQRQLLQINSQIAEIEIAPSAINYRIEYEKLDNKIAALEKVESDLRREKDELERLTAAQKSVKIAVEDINLMLALIYGNSKRLQLEVGSNQLYQLKVYGAPVKPSSLSQGEQNALALAYFFESIANGKYENNKYKFSVLIVIDDPISSFDADVKIGIFSLIKKYIREIYLGNGTSKVLLMTHDAISFINFQKIFKGIYGKKNYCLWRLQDRCIKSVEENGVKGEYELLISEAYKFATSEKEVNTYFIGNVLRRLLESVTTYHFKDGQCDFTSKPFNELDPKIKNEFENLCMRLCLNPGSHMEDLVKNDEDWVKTLGSFSEMQRVARTIFCVLYTLSPCHVVNFLLDDNSKSSESTQNDPKRDIQKTIEKWLTDI